MSVNPDMLLREFSQAAREVQHHAVKIENAVENLLKAKHPRTRAEIAARIVAHARWAQGAVQTPAITQFQQDTAPPPEARRQKAPGAPDDLRCKKCGEQRELADFFYDDGQGGYGYTKRCVACRRSGRKGGQLRSAA